LSGAFATSLITTVWDNKTIENHAQLTGLTDTDNSIRQMLENSGMTADAANGTIEQLIHSQSVMLATNQTMLLVAAAFIVAAFAIWLAPKPQRVVDVAAAGGH
jgi:MFS transporter, DHA2 family, multidrug resistance protein